MMLQENDKIIAKNFCRYKFYRNFALINKITNNLKERKIS